MVHNPQMFYAIWDDNLTHYDVKKHRDEIQKIIDKYFEENTGKTSKVWLRIEISSSGGSCDAYFALIGYVDELKSRYGIKIQTMALGQVSSMAVPMFLVGDERVMHSTSAMYLHMVTSTTVEKSSDDIPSLMAKETNLRMYHNRYINCIKKFVPDVNMKKLEKWITKEKWLTPEKAKSAGFVHEII